MAENNFKESGSSAVIEEAEETSQKKEDYAIADWRGEFTPEELEKFNASIDPKKIEELEENARMVNDRREAELKRTKDVREELARMVSQSENYSPSVNKTRFELISSEERGQIEQAIRIKEEIKQSHDFQELSLALKGGLTNYETGRYYPYEELNLRIQEYVKMREPKEPRLIPHALGLRDAVVRLVSAVPEESQKPKNKQDKQWWNPFS